VNHQHHVGRTGVEHLRASRLASELSGYLLGTDAAEVAKANLLTLALNEVGQEPSPLDRMSVELDEEERGRLRFGRTWRAQGLFKDLGPRWGRGLSLYLQTCPKHVRRELRAVFVAHRLPEFRNSDALVRVLKAMSDTYKLHGPNLTVHWKYYVNIAVVGGYLAVPDHEDFVEQVRDWVGKDRVHTAPDVNGVWSEAEFLRLFEEGVTKYVSLAPSVDRANRKAQSVKDWANAPVNWATSGSTDDKVHVVNYETRRAGRRRTYKAAKTKWRSALAMAPAEVVATVLTPLGRLKRQVAKAVEKRETLKVRAVMSSGNDIYLRMRYVQHWFAEAMGGHPETTLHMSSTQAQNMWAKLSVLTNAPNLVSVPLDQSNFDHNVNLRQVAVLLKVMRSFISNHARPDLVPNLVFVIDSLHQSLVVDKGVAVVPARDGKPEVEMPIVNGILSGWALTAEWDTMTNAGTQYAVEAIMARIGFLSKPVYRMFQGDDAALFFQSPAVAIATVELYREMGLDVNPSKFWVDVGRQEFLRQVIVGAGVSGYPARAITSLLWRKPSSSDPPAGITRVREQLGNWSLLASRGGDRVECSRLASIDIINANAISLDQLTTISGTPASLGGLGLFTGGGDFGHYSPGRITRRFRIERSTLIGLDHEVLSYSKLGLNIIDSDISSFAGSVLNLPHAEVEVAAGSVEAIERTSTHITSRTFAPKGYVPSVALGDPKLPPTLKQSALTSAVRSKNWDWIRNVYVAPEQRRFSLSLEKHGGRAVWLAWVTGDLPSSPPFVWGAGAGWVSSVHRNIFSSAWSTLCSRSSFSMSSVKRAAVSAETTTRYVIDSSSLYFGG
jgi:hypothetical protein